MCVCVCASGERMRFLRGGRLYINSIIYIYYQRNNIDFYLYLLSKPLVELVLL